MNDATSALRAEGALYPLKFEEGLRHYGFGGRRIAEHFRKDLPEGIIAETWEIVDHGDDVSIVRNGPLAGESLRALTAALGPRLLGRRVAADWPRGFPLLIKLLDAQKTLAMQVHPDDEYAAANEPGETGKTEAWYVIAADEGAVLYCGNKSGLSKEELVRAIEEKQPERCLERIPVTKGDTIYVPAGRMHAIGAGLLIYEAQQSCDLTYVPFSRPGQDEATARRRIEKFVEATRLEDLGEQRIPAVRLRHGANERAFLLANRYFAMELLRLGERWVQPLDGEKCQAYTVLEGSGRIEYDGGADEPFRKGESFLIPAAMGNVTIAPEGSTEMLVAYVPDILTDVVAPLRQMGVSPEAIAALGGPGVQNDVAPLVARGEPGGGVRSGR